MLLTLTLSEDLSAKLRYLAEKQNRTPEDVLRDLLASVPAPPNTQQPRTPGLGRGTIWTSDDFDDELGDDFWFSGE